MSMNFCIEATVSIDPDETRVSEYLESVNGQHIASAKPKASVKPDLPPVPLFCMAATRVASLPGGCYPLHLSSAWPAAIPANGRHGGPNQIHVAEPAHNPSPFRGRLNRTRLADALDVYLDEMSAEDQNKPRVRSDKRRVIKSLASFLQKERDAEPDIWVHEIQASDIYWYIRHLRNQPGKVREKGGQRGKSAPRTLEKKGRMLDHFFEFACKKLKACEENPVAGHRDIFEKLKQEASREGRHYLPFTSEQLQLIFDPHSYLRYSNQPDWFWVPLIAAHLGVRAGEVVQLIPLHTTSSMLRKSMI